MAGRCLLVLAILGSALALGGSATVASASVAYALDEDYDYCKAGMLDPHSYKPLALVDDADQAGRQWAPRLVAIVTRHGDRSPVNVLPREGDVAWDCTPLDRLTASPAGRDRGDAGTGPAFLKKMQIVPGQAFANALWAGSCAVGQLTPRGFEQLSDLGQRLREIYVNKLGFLRDEDLADSIYVRSTDVWRTQQSAEGLLHGLFGDGAKDGLQIPIHTLPQEIENMAANPQRCARLAEIRHELRNSPMWQGHLQSNQALRDHLNKIAGTGDRLDWSDSFDHFFDSFRGRTCHKMSLPCSQADSADDTECVTPEMAEEVFRIGDWEFSQVFHDYKSEEVARLSMGSLVKALHEAFDEAAEHPDPKTKFRLYSGHDVTIGPLLGALNQTGWRWPPYASQVLFELWSREHNNNNSNNKEEFVLRAFYNGKLMTLPFCERGTTCTLDEVRAWATGLVPEDVGEECRTARAPVEASHKLIIDDTHCIQTCEGPSGLCADNDTLSSTTATSAATSST